MKTLKIAISALILAMPFGAANADSDAKDVNVVNTPTVNVGNTATNPIPITVQNDPAKTPFHTAYDFSNPGSHADGSFGTVPDGMIAAIEGESLYCDISAGADIETTMLVTETTPGETTTNILYLPLQKTSSDGIKDYYNGAFNNKLYAVHDPDLNGDIFFSIRTTNASSIECNVSVEGHTVPYP